MKKLAKARIILAAASLSLLALNTAACSTPIAEAAATITPTVEPTAPGGRIGGPIVYTDSVLALDTDIYRGLGFRAGRAMITIEGDGDTDLDCFAYDARGREVARDDDRTDYCVLSWPVASAGRFSLAIRNLGRVYNVYTIRTN